MSPGNRVEVRVEPDEVLNKFTRQYRITAQSIRYAHAAIRMQPLDELPMLEVDGLAFTVDNPQLSCGPESQINETDAWLLRAAFIDLISGLNESLMEGCRIVRLYRRAKETEERPLLAKEQADAFIDRIDDEMIRMHIPELLSELQREVGEQLDLFDAIVSINKVRNCLVHRNGIVERKDVNDLAAQVLRLSYLQHQVFVLVSGVEYRLTRELKAQQPIVSGIKTEQEDISVAYPLGTSVQLSTDLFNDVAFTCFTFLHRLRLQVYRVIQAAPTQATLEIVLGKGDQAPR